MDTLRPSIACKWQQPLPPAVPHFHEDHAGNPYFLDDMVIYCPHFSGGQSLMDRHLTSPACRVSILQSYGTGYSIGPTVGQEHMDGAYAPG